MSWSNRRTQVWVDPEFQARFLRTALIHQTLICGVTALLTGLGVWMALDPNLGGGGRWEALIFYAALICVAVGALAIWLGLKLSHQICGPLYRIMEWLKVVRRGERPGPIKLRDGDEFCELAEAISGTIDAVVERMDERIAAERALDAPAKDSPSLEDLPDLVRVIAQADASAHEESASM